MPMNPTIGNLVNIKRFWEYTLLPQKLYKAEGTTVWPLILTVLQLNISRGLFSNVSHNSYHEAKYNAIIIIISAKYNGK